MGTLICCEMRMKIVFKRWFYMRIVLTAREYKDDYKIIAFVVYRKSPKAISASWKKG